MISNDKLSFDFSPMAGTSIIFAKESVIIPHNQRSIVSQIALWTRSKAAGKRNFVTFFTLNIQHDI